MPKSDTQFKTGNKKSAKPRGPTKKTRMKEESMKRVLDEQSRRELNIQPVRVRDVVDIEVQTNLIKMAVNAAMDSPHLKGRRPNHAWAKFLFERLEAPLQSIKMEIDDVSTTPRELILTVRNDDDYDNKTDPEATNYE